MRLIAFVGSVMSVALVAFALRDIWVGWTRMLTVDSELQSVVAAGVLFNVAVVVLFGAVAGWAFWTAFFAPDTKLKD